MASIASGAARLASNFRTSLDAVLAALFEPPCAACKSPLAHPLAGAVCETCWATVRTAVPRDEHCDRDQPLSWVMSVDSYEGTTKDIIHALKYDRRRSITPRLGAIMRQRGEPLLRDADCVVAVPLHPRREYLRGFNQAHDLAIHLGPPVVALLQRVRHTPSQIDLPRDQRLANVRDAFAFRLACPEREVPGWPGPSSRGACPEREVPGWPGPSSRGVPGIVVLVDDVSTTGATLEACARVLKGAGVREVRALTAARVVNAPR
jgi:predicted amidophosphoribosyltransferase